MTTKIEKLADLSNRANYIIGRIQNIDGAIEKHKKEKGKARRLLNVVSSGYDFGSVSHLSNTELRTKMTDYFLRIIRKEKRELQAELESLTKKLK